VGRVVILYAPTGGSGPRAWQRLEPVWNSATGYAEATIPLPGGRIQFFAQAVDATGNVALALDHGNPFLFGVADTTPPDITPTITGTLGQNGWYTSDVAVSWNVDDPESGIAESAGCVPVSLNADTTGTTLTCSATNGAGLSESQSVTIRIDKTPPSNIAFVGAINDGDVYDFGDVPPAPSCTAQDTTSGLAGCAVTGYSPAQGTHTLTAAAVDNAGNSATRTIRYTVRGWTFEGFFEPVDNSTNTTIVYNVVKAGNTVPLKFRVFKGGVELTDPLKVRPLDVQEVACVSDATEDEIEENTAGGTSLRYDMVTGQFIYNWKTANNMRGKCLSVTVTLEDGTARTAYFRLR
jgi:hypothetical protein